MMDKLAGIYRPAVWLDEQVVAPVVWLVLRIWVGWVFFKSGMNKFANMEITIFQFENEFEVPLLPPDIAAYAATGAELILPVLLVLGVAGRFGAVALFVFNAIAVISYPDMNAVGKVWHYAWGLALLPAAMYGPGTLSIDYFLRKRYMPE